MERVLLAFLKGKEEKVGQGRNQILPNLRRCLPSSPLILKRD